MALSRENIIEMIDRLQRDVAGTEHEVYLKEMRNRYAFLLEKLSGTLAAGRVLDVGASPGLFTELLRRAGYDAIGLDLFPHKRFPSAAGKKSANLFLDMNIPVVSADAADAPFPFSDASFDATMMNETIEHYIGSPLPCLLEIRRTLKAGGSCLLSTPNVAALSNRLRLLAGRNIYTRIEILVNVAPYKLHNREYAMYELEDLITRAGFSAAEKRWLNFGGADGGALKRAARPFYNAATAAFPPLRTNLYLRAEAR
ncbi:MAG: class I SAM-dependent methyltransferase [bacterium]